MAKLFVKPNAGIVVYDTIYDYIVGSKSSDYIIPDAGLRFSGVKIFGGPGNDILGGTYLSDTLRGGAGRDKIEGNDGDDRAFGGAGSDRITGDDGNDYLNGGPGKDVLQGDTFFVPIGGNDRLIGGANNDKLYGLIGDDTLSGGAGGDWLDGGVGHNVLSGGGGRDVFVCDFSEDAFFDTNVIVDFQDGIDRLYLNVLSLDFLNLRDETINGVNYTIINDSFFGDKVFILGVFSNQITTADIL